jgi:photosystem II stability/assembly factor-like uncharacterized protein
LPGLFSGQINALIVARGSVIYAATEGGVFKSDDQGAHWLPCNQGLSNRLVRALALDPDRPNVLYAGTRGGRIYKSTDGGDHWLDITGNISGSEIVALVVDTEDPDIVHAATSRNVYTTADAGSSWQLSSFASTAAIACMAMDVENPYILYVGARDGKLYLSPDRAATWLHPVQVSKSLEKLVTIPGKGALLYALAGGKVMRSQNRGQTWSFNDNYLEKTEARSLAIHPLDSSQILVGLDQGIHKSQDGRQSWYGVDGLPAGAVSALAYSPTKPDTIYAGVGGALYRSTDQGETWSLAGRIGQGLAASILAFLPDPRDASLLYASAGGGGLYRSVDGGQDWDLLDDLPSAWVTTLDLAPRETNILYAGTLEGRAWRSADGGSTWTESSAGLRAKAIRALAVHPERSTEAYLSVWGDGLYMTRNWTQGWERVEADFQEASKVLVDARAGRYIIYALNERGTWRGTFDIQGKLAGKWYIGEVSDLILGAANDVELIAASDLNATQLEGAANSPDLLVLHRTAGAAHAPRLLAQSRASPTLYGLFEGGVLRSSDLGATWQETGQGLEGRKIYTLTVHPVSQGLYAGTDQGIYYLPQ